ncbi:NAD(P)/FAD-dependent oxidoreductase [Aminithiophilus ramosus]|uniref:NAD(P)/FAD-dependent oxidoreductase n=2 Tax=Synergistales TaxID=649776 RepID=A0A9Q7F049_9BACT|nr:NAD(P)/FAD-dependent oxidoreductase [Aminithiophilus ramosus]QVL36707.1 NAD(P)/FAD-dependent oxidoreductase [Synergistota bacterium]
MPHLSTHDGGVLELTDKTYDILIVGAGIVGATLARELSAYALRVAVVDKAADIPSGASRANSAMIHAGYDDQPGTIKADFCPRGNRLYRELADPLDFTLRECGSYVCGFDSQDLKHLEKLLDQGRRNGVPGLEILSGDELRAKEPEASAEIAHALWAPTGSIINNFEAVLAFMDNAQQNGVELFLETEVRDLLLADDGSEIVGVVTNRGRFFAPVVVNAAGVNSDLIARMAGDESFFIRPTRGEYYIMDKRVGSLARGFFFACPTAKGKGITVAPTAENNLLIGPTSTVQTSRDDTSTTVMGLQEVIDGARRLIPRIPLNMAITAFSGVRANANTKDFIIDVAATPRGFVNAAGIKSPGFTSAPAIACHLVELMKERLSDRVSFVPDPTFVPERRHIPRFESLPTEEKIRLADSDPRYAQIVCRCEMVTEGQIVEAIARGARTVAGVKIWTRAGAGRCQGGFCGPRVIQILARELGCSPEEITRHGGHSRYLVGKTKDYWFRGEK